VGDGAHAEGEHVLLDAMPGRVALLSALIAELLSDPSNLSDLSDTAATNLSNFGPEGGS
jgi:hypothetical protein